MCCRGEGVLTPTHFALLHWFGPTVTFVSLFFFLFDFIFFYITIPWTKDRRNGLAQSVLEYIVPSFSIY